MSNSLYKRLTGKRRSIVSFTQLWMAPDHILLVRSSRITERYQRFALSDIQAVVVTATPDRTVFQILAMLAAIAWGAFALLTTSLFGRYFYVITGARPPLPLHSLHHRQSGASPSCLPPAHRREISRRPPPRHRSRSGTRSRRAHR
jgi:hypothetical protein